MNRSLFVALAGALGLAVMVTLPGFAAEAKPEATKAADAKKADGEGWIATLEGGDLAKHWVTTGNWKLTDGVIQLEPREGEKGWTRWSAYLWLKDKQYKPDPSAHAVYDELYCLYRELHDSFGGVAGAKADLGSLMKKLLAIRERQAH